MELSLLINTPKDAHSNLNAASPTLVGGANFESLVLTQTTQAEPVELASVSNDIVDQILALGETATELLSGDLTEQEDLAAATEIVAEILSIFNGLKDMTAGQISPSTIGSQSLPTDLTLRDVQKIVQGLEDIVLAPLGGLPTPANLLAAPPLQPDQAVSTAETKNPVLVAQDTKEPTALAVVSKTLDLLGVALRPTPTSPPAQMENRPIAQPIAQTIAHPNIKSLMSLDLKTPQPTANPAPSLKVDIPEINLPTQTTTVVVQAGQIVAEASKVVGAKVAVPTGVPVKSIKEQPVAPTSARSEVSAFDPRVQNLVSLIVKKISAAEVTTTSVTAAQVSSSVIRDLAAEPAAADFKPTFSLTAEQEIIDTLRIGSKISATPSKSNVENTQGTSFSRALTKQIQSVKISQGRTVIQLAPGGLGKLEIEIKTDDAGGLQIVMRAENPSVLNALRNDRDAVMQAMSQALPENTSTDLNFQEFKENLKNNNPGADEGLPFEQDDLDPSDPAVRQARQPLINSKQLDLLA